MAIGRLVLLCLISTVRSQDPNYERFKSNPYPDNGGDYRHGYPDYYRGYSGYGSDYGKGYPNYNGGYSGYGNDHAQGHTHYGKAYPVPSPAYSYFPSFKTDKTLTRVDKLHKRVDDVQGELRTAAEWLGNLESRLSLLKKFVDDLHLLIIPDLYEDESSRLQQIRQLEHHLNKTMGELGELESLVQGTEATNEQNADRQDENENVWVNQKRNDSRQAGRVAGLASAVGDFKDKLTTFLGNEFALFDDQVEVASGALAGMREFEKARMCENGEVTLDRDDRRAEILFQSSFASTPQVHDSITGFDFDLGSQHHAANSDGGNGFSGGYTGHAGYGGNIVYSNGNPAYSRSGNTDFSGGNTAFNGKTAYSRSGDTAYSGSGNRGNAGVDGNTAFGGKTAYSSGNPAYSKTGNTGYSRSGNTDFSVGNRDTAGFGGNTAFSSGKTAYSGSGNTAHESGNYAERRNSRSGNTAAYDGSGNIGFSGGNTGISGFGGNTGYSSGYGGYAPPEHLKKAPTSIGITTSAIASKTGVTFEVADLSFGDTRLRSVTIAYQACTIGPGRELSDAHDVITTTDIPTTTETHTD